MNSNPLATPVLFLVFNRPGTTIQVFNAIRKANPTILFIAADGPRPTREGEAEKCRAVREIVSNVDWDCEVKTLFRDENLGCGRAISGAINWFFEHVEEGIILEDDTLPSPSFFPYCSEILERYRHDTRIMEVSGTALPNQLMKKHEHSYYFSNWDHIWGWATWRRAWKHYDYAMTRYPDITEKKFLDQTYSTLYERQYMDYVMETSYINNDKVTWWSVQWGFARKINSGLVVVPLKNMIVNLGFGEEATNTANTTEWDFMTSEEMDFPLRHPDFIMHDRATDKEVFERYRTNPVSRIKGQLKNVIPKNIYEFAKSLVKRMPP